MVWSGKWTQNQKHISLLTTPFLFQAVRSDCSEFTFGNKDVLSWGRQLGLSLRGSPFWKYWELLTWGDLWGSRKLGENCDRFCQRCSATVADNLTECGWWEGGFEWGGMEGGTCGEEDEEEDGMWGVWDVAVLGKKEWDRNIHVERREGGRVGKRKNGGLGEMVRKKEQGREMRDR